MGNDAEQSADRRAEYAGLCGGCLCFFGRLMFNEFENQICDE